MPKNRDRIAGLPLPNPVIPTSTIYLCLPVPNATEYRQALKGALAELGKSWNWAHEINGNHDNADIAAELWRSKIAQSVYVDECGNVMNCDDLADCIETNTAARDAIADIISQQITNNTVIYEQSRNGIPMTQAQVNTPMAVSEGCQLDVLFGSITSIVDTLHQNNMDFLEMVEVQSNTLERVKDVIAAIPVAETLPIDDVVGFADTLIGEIKENYEAVYTSQLRDKYRCELFCLAKTRPDCELSFDDIFQFFESRLQIQLSPTNLLLNMFVFFSTGNWDGEEIVDVLTMAQLAVWRVASNFLGLPIRTFQQVGLLGANDPDQDYEIICLECEEPNLILHASNNYPSWTVKYDHTEGIYDYYTWEAVNTGNYGTGEAVSDNQTTFYVHEMTLIAGEMSGTIYVGAVQYTDPAAIPCDQPTNYLGFSQVPGGTKFMLKVALFPCSSPTVWLRPRTDGDHAGQSTVTFLGNTGDGDSIYAISSTRESGTNGYAVESTTEDGTALQTAYLVSATVDGQPTYYFYHERAQEASGLGDGASGVYGAQRWFWALTGPYKQTIIATFSPTPY